MTDHDDYVLHQLDPQLDVELDELDDGTGGAGWQPESRPIDPDIERAFQRELPRGHIAFAGGTALQHYNPKL